MALSLFKTHSNAFYRKQNAYKGHSFGFQDEFTFSLLRVDHICTNNKGNCFFCILSDKYNSFQYLSIIISFISICNIKQQNMVKHWKKPSLLPPNIWLYTHSTYPKPDPPQWIHACPQQWPWNQTNQVCNVIQNYLVNLLFSYILQMSHKVILQLSNHLGKKSNNSVSLWHLQKDGKAPAGAGLDQ